MRENYKVGLTGGIGTGKSIVARIFLCLGVPVYDADFHARELMNLSEVIKQKIIHHFGDNAYLGNKINRDYLSKRVFNHPEELQVLNSIVHPEVANHFEEWCRNHNDHQYILKEAALLFETDSFRQLDRVILVTSPIVLRMQRIKNRDPFRSENEIKAIMERQWKDVMKIDKSDFLIKNDESELIIPQVLTIHQSLLGLPKAKLKGSFI